MHLSTPHTVHKDTYVSSVERVGTRVGVLESLEDSVHAEKDRENDEK